MLITAHFSKIMLSSVDNPNKTVDNYLFIDFFYALALPTLSGTLKNQNHFVPLRRFLVILSLYSFTT